MKQLILFLLLIILFLPIAFAETNIFSGKVITDSEKVIDGKIFKFKYDENSNKVFTETPTTALIVDNGACKSNGVFRICINSANFSHKNITTYVYYYEVDVTIHKLTGSLSAVSKATSTTLLQGESTELTVTITNPTDFDIKNIVFKYDLSPFFIKEVKGCELNGRQMQWQGALQPKYDKICTAIIIAEKEATYNLAGNLSYFNGFENENKTTDSIAIKVLPKQLKVNYTIDKNIEIKKPFYINVSLQNIHTTEDITTSFNLGIPKYIKLLKDAPTFNKDTDIFKHNLILKPGYTMSYSLYLEVSSEGSEPISYKYTYTIKGISDIMENYTFLDIIGLKPLDTSSEFKEKQEADNATMSNISTTKDSVQSSQETKSNETLVETQTSNKTAEQVTLVEDKMPEKKPISDLFDKISLLFIAVIFIIIVIVPIIIYNIKKRKKEKDKVTNITEQNQNIFKPNI